MLQFRQKLFLFVLLGTGGGEFAVNVCPLSQVGILCQRTATVILIDPELLLPVSFLLLFQLLKLRDTGGDALLAGQNQGGLLLFPFLTYRQHLHDCPEHDALDLFLREQFSLWATAGFVRPALGASVIISG